MMTEKLLTQAIEQTTKLEFHEIFRVKDLFRGYEWKRLSRKDSFLLGRSFLRYVTEEKNVRIELVEKTARGQQKYKIVSK